MRHLLLYIAIFVTGSCFADSGEILIEGVYQGKNLFVQNPFCGESRGFSVEEVIVNNKVVLANVKSSAFEIDLSGYRLNESLSIRLIHKDGCVPKVINMQAIVVNKPFEFTNFAVHSNMIEWHTQGESVETVYFVERFMGNTWVAITPPINATGAAYIIKTNHEPGINKYRIKSLTGSGKVYYSAVKEYTPAEETVFYKP